jgi:uncharacterized protein YfaS (alpha-2-macroglobulin family)
MLCLSEDTPASLVGAAAVVHVTRSDGTSISRVGTTTPSVQGGVSMDWEVGDLTVAGIWQVEVEVTYANGRVQTFGPARFAVRDQLA